MPDITFRVVSPEGTAVPNVMLLVAYPNRTYRTGPTDAHGERTFNLYRTDQEMLVLGGATGFLPLQDKVTPGSGDTIRLVMKPSEDGRSGLIFTSSTGCIPGIEGQLNPVNDGRTHVYTDNIAINDRPAYPTVFEIGETLHLVDVYGVETDIRFLVVTARFSLIEYTRPRPYGG